MSTVDICLHLFGPKERIVDKRVDTGSVVDIDYIRSQLFDLVDEFVVMIVAFAPLLIRIDRAEGGNQQIEIVIQSISLFHIASAGISVDAGAVGSVVDIDTAFPAVRPGYGLM